MVEKPGGDDDHDAQCHPGRDEVERAGLRNPLTRPALVRSGSLSKPPTDRRDSRSGTIWAVSPPSALTSPFMLCVRLCCELA
jgi:hypothetical protein